MAVSLALIASGAAAPAPAACQDLDNSVAECMCIFGTDADQFKRSELVFIGRISGRQAPEPGYGIGGPEARVVDVERLDKGRAVSRRLKVLDPPNYGGCSCSANLPNDLNRHRFYLTPSHDQPGYYVLSRLGPAA